MITSFNWIIRMTAVVFFGLWRLYWLITARKTDKEKPKNKQVTLKSYFERIVQTSAGLFLLIQLFGLRILPTPDNIFIQIIGLALLVLGIVIAVSARISLGTNWTQSYDYQIKKNHELVSKGIYQYIRHPIYLSVILVYTGGLIISQTYLFTVFLIILSIWAYSHGKREEKILLKQFGGNYHDYMKKTKMFIPFII